MRLFFIIFCVSLGLVKVNAQNADAEDSDNDTTMTMEEQNISSYAKFNPVLGGDSIRWQAPGVKFNGPYEEYYKNGKTKHKGNYENGQLTTFYKDYFENGQLQCSFKVIDSHTSQMEIYYKNGTLNSKIQYLKGQILSEVDYYPTGKVKFTEEYDKSLEWLTSKQFFFFNGNIQRIIELENKRNLIYDSKEYWNNGNVKEDGYMIYNNATHSFIKNGTWNIYNADGKKIMEEEYVKGKVTNSRTF
jgi:antitoxin component YwqK of YwqJK toxin-antitoxin module